MKLAIEIDLDNEAFLAYVPKIGCEVARILHAYADRCDDKCVFDGWDSKLIDVNGNQVGRATVREEDDDE